MDGEMRTDGDEWKRRRDGERGKRRSERRRREGRRRMPAGCCLCPPNSNHASIESEMRDGVRMSARKSESGTREMESLFFFAFLRERSHSIGEITFSFFIFILDILLISFSSFVETFVFISMSLTTLRIG